MVYLTEVGRTDLIAAVRNYLESVPNIHAAEKDPYYSCNSSYLSNFLSRTFCSSSRPPPAGHEYVLYLNDFISANGSQNDVASVQNFNLVNDHKRSIRKTLTKKRGISVVYLTLQSQHNRHDCLLIFDARTRRQHFFNPWGYRQHWLSIAFATRPTELVDGFTKASVNMDAWENVQVSMQSRIDHNMHGVPGNCALFCVLIATLCTRFGVGRPKVMGEIVMEAMKQIDDAHGFNADIHNPSHSHISRLWNWMNHMSDVAKRTRTLPVLYANSIVSAEMVADRQRRRQEALKTLRQYPQLRPGPPTYYTDAQINRRQMLRNRQFQYLSNYPALQQGQVVTATAVAEREETHRQAEVELLTMMFPSSPYCEVLLRSGKLCSRRACVGQPLCWQHRFLTRNHQLTGQGRMRCAAPQQPCV